MGPIVIVLAAIIFVTIVVVKTLIDHTNEKRKLEEEKLRISSLKQGDEFFEYHWRKNSFKIIEISQSKSLVKIERSNGETQILNIDKFKEKQILLKKEESNYEYESYIKKEELES